MTRDFAKLVLDSLSTWEGRERMITAEQVEAIKVLSQEHPLPEGLEEAAEYLASDIAPTYPDISWDDCYERIKEGVIAGAEWDRVKMMEKAVSGRYMKADGKVYVESWLLDIDTDSVKAGDEVRLIVIPKEE